MSLSRTRRVVLTLVVCGWIGGAVAEDGISAWVSTQDMTRLLDQEILAWSEETTVLEADIQIDPSLRYQTILGMGASLEHATCYNLSQLPSDLRAQVVERIVSPVSGMGMNLMRICFGTSDFTSDPWYSYDDSPDGQPDPELKNFSIQKDRDYVLPILKLAQEKNSDLLFFASTWSPPGWMKTSGRMTGGRLLPEYYDAYAAYLIRAVEAYEREGIPIHAITLQNEPRYAPNTYPTSLWSGEKQAQFIQDSFGPAVTAAGKPIRVWCWDHNFNELDFPRAVLGNPAAARFVDGTAFHHYEGEPEAMTTLHGEYPDKDIYFAEGSTFGVRGAAKIISYLRNWARSYNAWVTVLDENQKPNNGPHGASATCIVRNSDTNTVEYRFDYYMYAQFMRFIQRDATRIESTNGTMSVTNVAFENPDGSIVCVVANSDRDDRVVLIGEGVRTFSASVPGHSVATFRWMP